MKKFTAFLLVLCALAGLSVTGFADDTIDCLHLGKCDESSDYSPTKHMVINRSGTIADCESGADVVYDTKGNILTRTDEDGTVWEYVYSPSGSFMYRIGTIADPAWTISEKIKFSNLFKSSAAVFDIPYENCVGFDISFEVTERKFSSPNGNIAVYVSEPEVSSSVYQQEGVFVYDGEEAEVYYTVELESPVTVAAVCLRPMNAGPIDYSACMGIFNIRIKSYDYM